MPIGYHVQNSIDLNKLPDVPDRLRQTYENAGELLEESSVKIPGKWERLYIGDEFCIHRLPDLTRLEEVLSFSGQMDVSVTLLTPVVSDCGIDICKVLFKHLADNAPDTEVVVNDWGMLLFLKEAFPILPLSLGRLLNKGFNRSSCPQKISYVMSAS